MLNQSPILEPAASSSFTHVLTCSDEQDVTESSARSSLTLVSEELAKTVTLSATTSTLDLKSAEKNIGGLENKYNRVDGGINAWLFLLGAFMVEGLLFGMHSV